MNCILRDYFLPKLILTLQSWLDIISDDTSELEEILTWYSGWKQFLLEGENKELVQKDKIEEGFYLMMLMINEKVWINFLEVTIN